MVDISELSPGMRVKIVDKWGAGCGQNSAGKMDKWLGKIMTVREITTGYFSGRRTLPAVMMHEDMADNERGWYWNKYSIDYIVDESEDNDAPIIPIEIDMFL